MILPMVWPGSPDTRTTDPHTSHAAADKATRRTLTRLVVERALTAAGRPVTADEAYRIARFELGYPVTPQRVRTVLAENNDGPWVRLEQTGLSDFGNEAHLWELKEQP